MARLALAANTGRTPAPDSNLDDALSIAGVDRTKATGASPFDGDETQERLFTPRAQFSGQLVNLAASLAFYFVMRSRVPPDRMRLWIAINVLCLSAMLVTHLSFYLFGRSSARGLELWLKFDRAVAITNEIAALATIFLLLPFADSEQRMFATAYFVGYFPCSIFSDPGNVAPNRRAVLVVLTAFAAWLFLSGGFGAKMLAGLVLVYAAFMTYAMGGIARIVRDAVTARAGMEQANAALNAALAEVSAERDAKTRFIATASHDLGQPLQAARLYGDSIAAAPDGPGRDRAISGLTAALGSAQAMLSHMLYHMRLEADAVTPHLAEVDLGDMLMRLQNQFAPQAASAGIAVRTVHSTARVVTDPVLLERAIGNLVQNALTHSGGSRLLLGVRPSRTAVRIWAIDNGVGVPADEAASLFEDYTRGAAPRAQMAGGFGLGLASVRRLARLLGGRVWLVSPPGKGAAFCLELPRGDRR